MKQLLILSGKGGTGKTTVAGAFIQLSGAKAFADCDVDAPNLHLIFHWDSPPRTADYFGMPKAAIDPELCSGCGKCLELCRFGAVFPGTPYEVDPLACEGCGVCRKFCPEGAVSMAPAKAGGLSLFRGGERVFSTAKLRMGQGTSGKLVSEVKKRLALAAPDAELSVIDGSPGIGCPVIASVSGTDLVLIVAEPSASGISDMERVLKAARILGAPAAVCVNKADANPSKTEAIQKYCAEAGIPFVGTIPYDPEAVIAANSGRSIAGADCPAGRAVRKVYEETAALLLGKEHKNDCQRPV